MTKKHDKPNISDAKKLEKENKLSKALKANITRRKQVKHNKEQESK